MPWRSTTPEMKTKCILRIGSSADVVAARQQARALASRVGFSDSNLTVIATAVSEVVRNIVEYAKEGEVTIRLISRGG